MGSQPPPSQPPPSKLYADESRIARSWRLTGAAWRLMRGSSAMLMLAFFGLASAVVSTFLIFYFAGYFSPGPHSSRSLALYGAICSYPTVFISVFINVALAYAASAAFDGEKVELGEALDAAASRVRTIAVWSLISVVVGFILNQIAERLPGGGRIATRILGAAWGIGTLFVVPMLAVERTPAVPALRRSVGIAKRRWAEGVAGNIAIGAWTAIVGVPAIMTLLIGANVADANPAAGVAMMYVGLVVFVSAIALSASTGQVFAVALYRHAIDAPTGGFSTWDLENPFTGKPKPKRKSWILRIGGAFLAGMVVLIVIAAIVGHRDRTGGDPYWHISFPAGHARELPPGTPITYHGRRAGTVFTSRVEGPLVNIGFQVKPAYRRNLLRQTLVITRRSGHVFLRIVAR